MSADIKNSKIQEILQAYNGALKSTWEALQTAGVPESLTYVYTFLPVSKSGLFPDDMSILFKSIREDVILFYYKLGLSPREIAKRIGGSSYRIIVDIIKQFDKQGAIAKAHPEEVTKTNE